MKKKLKVPKNNISEINKSIKATHPDTELVPDLYTGELNPYPLSFIKSIAEQALDYCVNNPRGLKITQFIREKRLRRETYYDWVRRYDWFRKNHEECMAALGDKREVGASFKELDREMQLRVLHLYDPEWVKINEYWKLNKESEEDSQKVFNVYLNKPDVIKKEEKNEPSE